MKSIVSKPDISAYEKIRKYVISQIARSGSSPMRLASNRELAKQFGVSHPTVIRAVKDLIEDGFLTVKRGIGTFTNPSLIQTPEGTKIFGILLSDGKATFMDRNIWRFAPALSERLLASSSRVRIQLCHLAQSRANACKELQSMRLDGLLCISPGDAIIREQIGKLKNSGLPVVSIGLNKVPGVSSFSYDFRRDNRKVAELMLAEGRRRIVLMLPAECAFAEEACAGVEEAFSAKGLSYDRGFAIRDTQEERNGFAHTLSAFKPDGMIFNCEIEPYWKTIKAKLDIKEGCRLYSGAMSIFDDLEFEGYAGETDPGRDTAIAIANLQEQIKSPGKAKILDLPVTMDIRLRKA